MERLLAEFAGSLIGYGLLSRLVLWLTRKVTLPRRILLSHGVTLGASTFIAGYGRADVGGPPRFGEAFFQYLLPAIVWFAFDWVRLRRRNLPAAGKA